MGKAIALLLVCAGASSGCGYSAKYVGSPQAIPAFEDYRVVEVAPVRAGDTWEPILATNLHLLRDEIVRSFVRQGNKKLVAALADSSSQPTLVVQAELTGFDRGDEWARLLVGRGEGSGTMTLRVDYLDESSGRLVGHTDIRATSGGLFVDRVDETKLVRTLAEATARYVKNRGRGPEKRAWDF